MRETHKHMEGQFYSKSWWAIKPAVKNRSIMNYHVWIDDLIYGSPRESFHKFVKRSVYDDSKN